MKAKILLSLVGTSLVTFAFRPAMAVDLPPGLTPSGGTDTQDYNLTANSSVDGYGTFTGSFNTNSHSLTTIATAGGTLTFDGVISGSAVSPIPSLMVYGSANAVILNGANTFTGDVVLEAGTLQLGNALALGTAAGIFRVNGASTLDLNGQSIAAEAAETSATTVFRNSSATAASWGGSIDVQGSTLTFNTASGDITLSGNLTGSGGIAKSGSHVLTVSGSNAGLTSVWNLEAGTLKLGSSTAVGAGVGVSGTGATLDLNGQTVTGKPIELASANVTIANTSQDEATWTGSLVNTTNGELIFNLGDGDVVMAGSISGSGDLIKNGSAALNLTSASTTFTGDTLINDGSVNFLGESIFVIGANGVSNAISGAGTGTFDGTFAFNLTGAATAVGSSWVIVDLDVASWNGNFEVLGFTEAEANLWTRNHFGTQYEFRTTATGGELSVVPEPSTFLLAALGAGVLWFRRRTMRNSAV